MEPLDVRREAERLIGEDRVPTDVLAELIAQYGDEPDGPRVVTLLGLIPVYVRVDRDENEVTRVVADDSALVYVGDVVYDDAGKWLASKRVGTVGAQRPIAYGPSDELIEDDAVIADALATAENPDLPWPAWNWGW